jgi:hypothetical protein
VKPGAPNAHPFPRPANIGKLFAYRGKREAKQAAKRAQDRKMALLRKVDTHRAAEKERNDETRWQFFLEAEERRRNEKEYPPSSNPAGAA